MKRSIVYLVAALAVIGLSATSCKKTTTENDSANVVVESDSMVVVDTTTIDTPTVEIEEPAAEPQQEVAEVEEEPVVEENHDAEITAFIKNLYSKYVFNDGNFNKVKSNFSKSVLNRLVSEYEGGGYAVWNLRLDIQDGPSDVCAVTNVTPAGDGWYVVKFLDMGINGSKRFKAEYNNGKVIITDFR